MEHDPRKFIYGGMNENQIIYIKENLGLILNEALQQVSNFKATGSEERERTWRF